MEGIDARVQRKEVRKHTGEQVQLALAKEGVLVQLQAGVQAAYRLALHQPVDGRGHRVVDAIQALASGAGLLQVVQGGEVVGADHRLERLGREQRQVVQ